MPKPPALARFILTDADVIRLAAVAKPRLLSLDDQRSPHDMANAEWKIIGERLGFDWTTVIKDPKSRDAGTILAQPLPPKEP